MSAARSQKTTSLSLCLTCIYMHAPVSTCNCGVSRKLLSLCSEPVSCLQHKKQVYTGPHHVNVSVKAPACVHIIVSTDLKHLRCNRNRGSDPQDALIRYVRFACAVSALLMLYTVGWHPVDKTRRTRCTMCILIACNSDTFRLTCESASLLLVNSFSVGCGLYTAFRRSNA